MPQLSSGIQCSRVLLTILNMVFLVCGLGVLGIGFYIIAHGRFNAILAVYNITQALGSTTMFWTGISFIVLGALTTCLACIGFIGSAYKKITPLYIYAFVLIVIILLEFSALIALLQFRTDLWESYDTGFQDIFQDAYRTNQTQTIAVIKQLERVFQCCGVDSFADYTFHGLTPPPDCYPNQDQSQHIFEIGCAPAVALWVWNTLPYIVGVIALILLIEIFCIISSIVLGVITAYERNIDHFPRHSIQS